MALPKIAQNPKKGSTRQRIFKVLYPLATTDPKAGMSANEIRDAADLPEKSGTLLTIIREELANKRLVRAKRDSDGSYIVYSYILTPKGRTDFLEGVFSRRSDCGRGVGAGWTPAMKKNVTEGIKAFHNGEPAPAKKQKQPKKQKAKTKK